MSNRYLEKLAARIRIKGKHLHKAKELVQDELIERGIEVVKEHHKKYPHSHEKTAIALSLYEHPTTQQRRWIVNGKDVPVGWIEVKKTYKKFPKKA